MVGFARSLATKQTYGAKSENEEGRAAGKGVTVATEKLSKATKSGSSRNPTEKVSNNFLPAYQKNSYKTFRAYRACRDVTLPPEQRWDQKGKS